jgi:transcriptional regulator with XRE-family HTH domain
MRMCAPLLCAFVRISQPAAISGVVREGRMVREGPYPHRNYAVAEQLLLLRSKAKLTQAELAARAGVHRRSLQKWESGETYPTAVSLRDLIAALLALGVFAPGREQAEATELWQMVSRAAPQHLPPFDPGWFDQLQGKLIDNAPAPAAGGPRVD